MLTFLTIAFISAGYVPKVEEEYHQLIESIKERLKPVIGESIVFNLIGEPEIKIPKDDEIKESFNLLQNAQILENVDLKKKIKEEVYKRLAAEKKEKNWYCLFKNKQMYDNAEIEVRRQIALNLIEIVLTGQTIFVNKYLNEYNNVKSKIPEDKVCELFLYHGSRIANHKGIITKHFSMPFDDKDIDHAKIERRDKGYFGKGIYATDNMFYAAAYANGTFNLLTYNKKAPVICCLSVFNKDYVDKIENYDGNVEVLDETKSKFGVNRALVGSGVKYKAISKEYKDQNFVYAKEYVFPNKYQIVPICSFMVKRSEYFILWKDDNIENNENK